MDISFGLLDIQRVQRALMNGAVGGVVGRCTVDRMNPESIRNSPISVQALVQLKRQDLIRKLRVHVLQRTAFMLHYTTVNSAFFVR